MARKSKYLNPYAFRWSRLEAIAKSNGDRTVTGLGWIVYFDCRSKKRSGIVSKAVSVTIIAFVALIAALPFVL